MAGIKFQKAVAFVHSNRHTEKGIMGTVHDQWNMNKNNARGIAIPDPELYYRIIVIKHNMALEQP